MSARTQQIPNLLNGVSTQDPALRLPTQGEIQINGYSTLTKGLIKRPPTLHKKNLGTVTNITNAHFHWIDRDSTEKYFVGITNGDLKVYDLLGVEKTVTFPNGKTYLNHTTPPTGFAVQTVADYTFISNKSVIPAMKSTLSSSRSPEALVNVILGNYGKNYDIIIDNVRAARYLTPDGSHRSQYALIDTKAIADILEYILDNSPSSSTVSLSLGGISFGGTMALQNDETTLVSGTTTGYTAADWAITRIQNVLHIKRDNNADFTIAVSDGFGGNAMKVIKSQVQRFTDLPSRCVDGFYVEVTGESSNAFDNYYVKFVKSQTADIGEGVWKETIKQGIKYMLDEATMPHILVRNGDGTFTFKRATWSNRLVGDETSNPEPSFIGQPITDIFFHRNRLGFTAGENVIMSVAGDFFNFWRQTATVLLDDDPIDVGSSYQKVSKFTNALPFGLDLLLFGPKVQLRLNSGDTLTPKTAAIRPFAEFVMDSGVRPVVSGTLLYWPSTDNNRTIIRELWMDENGDVQSPLETNSHCPEFIPKNITNMAVSADLSLLLCSSSDYPTRLYVHKFLWAGREKPQASWSYWDLGVTILAYQFYTDGLYILIQDGTDTRLLIMPCQVNYMDTGLTYSLLLDQRVSTADLSAGTYDAVNDWTSYTMPYAPGATIEAWSTYDAAGFTYKPGHKLEVRARSGTTIRIDGDTRNDTLVFGYPYRFQYRFSRFMLREPSESGSNVAVVDGRVQVLRVGLLYANSGYFKIEVNPENRAKITSEATVNSGIIDDPLFSTTDVNLESGTFRFPVKCENSKVYIDIINDTALPSNFISAEWFALWHQRTRRG